jgi:hypothetical protein
MVTLNIRTGYMATVTRTTAQPTETAPAIEVNRSAPLQIRLPTKPREPIYDINRHRFMVTGEAGVGKTTLGTVEPGVFNLSFDPLRETYAIMQEFCPDWRHFLGYLQLLEGQAKAGKLAYKRIQIDGTEIWYRHCLNYVITNKLGGAHPSEADYGKGWDALNSELSSAADRIMALPCGIWFTSHGKEKPFKRWDGTEIIRIAAELSNRANEVVCGRCDVIMNMQYIGPDSRIATIRGNDAIQAKCDVNGRFLTTDGRQVKEIVLGAEGPEVAWNKLLRAYDNGQGWVDYAEMQALLAKQKKAKAKVRTETTNGDNG